VQRQDLVDTGETEHGGDLGLSPAKGEITSPRPADHDTGEQHSEADGIEEIDAQQIDDDQWLSARVMDRREQSGTSLGCDSEVEITDQTDHRDRVELRDHEFDAQRIG
jgi:hypothetical protein